MLDRRSFMTTCAAVATTAVASATALNASTRASGPTAEQKDGVRWVRLSSGHKVWTRRVGRGVTKILLLHGGPGFSHDYMDCFAEFLPREGYEMYFYDQLGCGLSDRPANTDLWTLPRYLTEVEEVRLALGLNDFVLIGHSWGGILGIEYALRHPKPLKGFVLSDMTASFADFERYTGQLKAGLPQPVREKLAALEASHEEASDEYGAILQQELYTRYICRLDPWPAGLQKSFAVANQTIYNQMQGPNEFTITGNLKDWNRWSDLPRLKMPVLVTGACFDEMDPASVEREAALIPGAQLFMSETGSHLAMWDDQQAYFSALLKFLASLRR